MVRPLLAIGEIRLLNKKKSGFRYLIGIRRKKFGKFYRFGKIAENVVWTPSKKRFFQKKNFNIHGKFLVKKSNVRYIN